MARLIYPDPGSQLVYQRVGTNLRAANGQTATVYMDATGTTLANIAAYDPNAPGTPGAVISGSTLTVDTYSRLPSFWGPATGEDTLWVTVNNGPLVPVNSYYDPRIDAILAAGPVPGTRQVIAGAGLTGGGALSADVTLDVDFGTVAGTVAAGDAPAAAQAAAIAASQPVDADLTTIAGLDSTQSGVVASDGAGWLRKTYAALKTSLSLVKGDVGLGNVDNTSDAAKPVSTATQTALNLKASTTHATTHEPSGSDPMAVDAAAATGSLRTLGTGAAQAAKGDTTVNLTGNQTITGDKTFTGLGVLETSTGVAGLGAKNGQGNIRLAGFKASAGAPTTGTWAVGDEILSNDGGWYQCTVAGTPGTWVSGLVGKTFADVFMGTPATIGTSTAQTLTNGTPATFNIDTAITDANSLFNTTSHVYTVPATGVYSCDARIRLVDGTAIGANLGVGVDTSNDTGSTSFCWYQIPNNGSQNRLSLQYARVAMFTAGDFIRIFGLAIGFNVAVSAAQLTIYRVS